MGVRVAVGVTLGVVLFWGVNAAVNFFLALFESVGVWVAFACVCAAFGVAVGVDTSLEVQPPKSSTAAARNISILRSIIQ